MQYYPITTNKVYNGAMAGRPALTEAPEQGARLAKLRIEAGMTQVQLAEAIGTTSRSITFYERKANFIPSDLALKLATALGISVNTLLGVSKASSEKKRGPKSDIEKRLDEIKSLPKSAQKRILSVVDAMVAQEEAKAS